MRKIFLKETDSKRKEITMRITARTTITISKDVPDEASVDAKVQAIEELERQVEDAFSKPDISHTNIIMSTEQC